MIEFFDNRPEFEISAKEKIADDGSSYVEVHIDDPGYEKCTKKKQVSYEPTCDVYLLYRSVKGPFKDYRKLCIRESGTIFCQHSLTQKITDKNVVLGKTYWYRVGKFTPDDGEQVETQEVKTREFDIHSNSDKITIKGTTESQNYAITSDLTSLSLAVGTIQQITVNIEPNKYTVNLILESLDTNIAIVNFGYVSAIAPGDTIIRVYSEEHPDNIIEIPITVF